MRFVRMEDGSDWLEYSDPQQESLDIVLKEWASGRNQGLLITAPNLQAPLRCVASGVVN